MHRLNCPACCTHRGREVEVSADEDGRPAVARCQGVARAEERLHLQGLEVEGLRTLACWGARGMADWLREGTAEG